MIKWGIEHHLANNGIFLFSDRCAIEERNYKGESKGRCFGLVVNGMCAYHGNVESAQMSYRATGSLSDPPSDELNFEITIVEKKSVIDWLFK